MATLAKQARRLKLILVTDRARLEDPLGAALALPRGAAVLLRDYDLPGRARLAQALAALCRRRGLQLFVAGDPRLALAVKAAGLHLPEAMLARGGLALHLWKRWRPGGLLTAAAHSRRALAAARRAGCDAALLSPVFPTASHPSARPIGLPRAAAWTRRAGLPVYALGGIDGRTAPRLRGSGVAGLAAVSGLAANKKGGSA